MSVEHLAQAPSGSGAEGGTGNTTATGVRSVMEGIGLNAEGLAAQVFIGCVEANRDTALFVKDSYALLDFHGVVLGCDIPEANRLAAVTSADCVAFLLSPEAIESMYDSKKGLGAQIKATIETRSRYILLSTPGFRWSLVDAKRLDWGVKDIFLDDYLEVDLSSGFTDALDGRMVVPANASTSMNWYFTLILTLLTMLVPAVFVLVFSGMGFGVEVFKVLSKFWGYPTAILLAFALVLFLILYLFDFSYWTAKFKAVRTVMMVLIALAVFAAGVSAAKIYPSAPQALFMVGVPAYVFIIKRVLFRRQEISAYLGSLAIALAATTVGLLATWIYYLTLPGVGMWDAELRTKYRIAMNCHDVEYCLAAFLLWLSPLVAAIASMVFSLMVFFLSRSVKAKGGSRLQAAMKLFFMLLAMSMLGMWIAASIAGASMSLSNVIMMFCAAAAVILGVTIVSQVGWQSLKTKIQSMPQLQKMAKSPLMVWVKGALVMVASPVFVLYVFLSFLNQFIRTKISCGRNIYEDKPEAKKYKITLVAHNQIENMKEWNWTNVLVKTIWIGVFFICINVGVGKLTTLFLSWLNTALSSLQVALVFVIFFFVGLFMFLLPPVPGVPVYLTGGIILVTAVQGPNGDNYLLGCVLACILCFLIKLTAIAMQQKLIGQSMSGFVAVRNFVGINSISIRAIRMVLSKSGLNLGKVAILIGGPDWPTSVLTGIMKLSLVQMLIGSLPVALLIIPTTLAGAFQLRKSVSPTWESIASVTLSVAALVQSGALLAAMYYVEKTVSGNRDELDAEELDEEVAKCEVRQQQAREAYASATHWSIVPWFMRGVLILAAILQAVAAWIIFFDSDDCFESFEVTDSISSPPLNGNALNMFKLQGIVISCVFLASCLLLWIFKLWAGHRVKKRIKTRTRLGSDDDEEKDEIESVPLGDTTVVVVSSGNVEPTPSQ